MIHALRRAARRGASTAPTAAAAAAARFAVPTWRSFSASAFRATTIVAVRKGKQVSSKKKVEFCYENN